MNPKVLLRSLILLVITFVAITIYWLNFAPRPKQLPSIPTLEDGDNPYSDLFIPSFSLQDRNNNSFDQSYLDGHYTVIDFFYTSCPLICPGMSAAMRDVQDQTRDTDLRLLSISIDPEVDSPDVINTYANAFRADPDRWKFGTGTKEMTMILLKGVQFELGDLDQDDGFRNIDHPASLLLVGPDRHVIGLYRYSDPDQFNALVKKARELAG